MELKLKEMVNSLADELWAFGAWHNSRGCCMEIEFAKALGMPIYLGGARWK